MSNSLQPHGLYSPWNSPGHNTRVGSLFLLQGIFPTQGLTHTSCIAHRFFPAEPPGKPPVQQGHHYNNEMKMKIAQSCLTLCNPMGLYSPWNSLGQNTGVDSLSLLLLIFPTQGSNPGPPHHRQILYQPSHKGSPRILEWVAYPFSSRSAQPSN